MRKAVRGIAGFFEILGYCIKLLWKTSREYFIIRILLNIDSRADPLLLSGLNHTCGHGWPHGRGVCLCILHWAAELFAAQCSSMRTERIYPECVHIYEWRFYI